MAPKKMVDHKSQLILLCLVMVYAKILRQSWNLVIPITRTKLPVSIHSFHPEADKAFMYLQMKMIHMYVKPANESICTLYSSDVHTYKLVCQGEQSSTVEVYHI